ncbi:RNA-directed DNA polymerase, eukaryota, reverse transcriptase zinc-binding domain protein [Tanacetum coccineum]|uniref:RNA-directed DNA polymerase, eukaryota, reverse transcriptase zinc-binding domain protein n=1 Tax=Tanacetum coccineum TaxID=301880 RepID=A0ABQ5DDL0_9ASTR
MHDAKMVKDFKPITLIGTLYKIIAKILANRLVVVLGDIINEVQSAFVANMQILDGPFILNELFHWCKKKKKHTMIFKVDFEKAYDLIRWDYLDDVLKNFGFGDRGLKESDPLSPFLFILIMESLHILVQRVVDACMYRGISMGSCLHLLHLFYADDVVFMGHWSDSNTDTIVQELESFYRASGLRINMNKSKLTGISVANDNVDQAAAKTGCVTLKAHLSYLGSKVGGLMSRVQSWNEIVNNLVARLSNLKMKTLSIGVRLTLLKSVLGSMPIYHMSLFKVPMKVLQRTEYIRCHFFSGVDNNGKKPIWVKWNKVLTSKEKGGLGVSSFYALNIAFLFKWRGDGAFKSLYPRVYALETCKNITVAVKMSHENVGYFLRRIPRGGIEEVQLLELSASMEGVAPVDMRDRWVWSLKGSGEFFVASVRRLIDERWLPEVSTITRWINVVPIKVNVHAWKVRLYCLPARLNISRRGMHIDSILCPICDKAVEYARHIFFACHIAREVFHKITSWWDVNFMEVSSYEEWLE